MKLDEHISAKLRADMGDEEFKRFMFERTVPGVLATLGLARVRCMTFAELLASLPKIDKIKDVPLIINRFYGLDFDSPQESSLVPVLKLLADKTETLPSKQKARVH